MKAWSKDQAEASLSSVATVAFDRDTQIELAKQLARHWVIAHYLRTGHLPNSAKFYAYPNDAGFRWGADEKGPLHQKRVVVTLTIEDQARG